MATAAPVADYAGVASPTGRPVATDAVNLPPSYRFEPAAITVPAGTTVDWTNNDNFSHSIRFLDGGLPSEPMMMSPGEAVELTSRRPDNTATSATSIGRT
ncbi:MAG: hypothetical protein M3N29_00730 [Chloroflexota bacterium]|nr:hypothetical protein [Chloroflexota bacterium]